MPSIAKQLNNTLNLHQYTGKSQKYMHYTLGLREALLKFMMEAFGHCPFFSAWGGGGGAKAIRAMPKCLQHVVEEGFPNYGL